MNVSSQVAMLSLASSSVVLLSNRNDAHANDEVNYENFRYIWSTH